jgi:protein-S-isoprenylcysteine O-methyltransferase Ste14
MAAYPGLVVVALWVAWMVFWAVSAARAPRAPERRDQGLAVWAYRGPLVVAMWLLFAPWMTLGLLDLQYSVHSMVLVAVGWSLVVIGLGVTVWARLSLGEQWSGRVGVGSDHRLVQSGPYRFVRHPIYSGILLAFAGSAMALGGWRCLVAFVLAASALWFKLRREDRLMAELFKDDYPAYKARVPALIPLVL